MAKNQQIAAFQASNFGKVANIGLSSIGKNPDILLAAGVMLILALLIVPLPAFMLDVFLAANISISVLILLISLYLVKPSDFSSFPTILLITTLFRLGLN